MIIFVAQQLDVSPAVFADYALRDQTRREHAGRAATASSAAELRAG
jgi:hypothetical protein